MRPLVVLALCAACAGEPAAPAEVAATPGAAIEKTSTQGPLAARVTVAPDKPRVGDVLRLVLTVDAAAGTEVTMPPFGEALGRFDVVGFAPREETLPDGKRRYVQDYRLQASRSGRLRIPPLRIEYSSPAPSGSGSGMGEELLTEEIPLEIESVLTAEGAGTLAAPRGALDETIARPWLLPAALAGGLIAIVLAVLVVRRVRRRAAVEIRRSAADVALGRLGLLAGGGLPTDRDTADPFYVELSDIVRRYLEDRFGVRAPELTTEEFLREVRVMPGFADEHRALVADFLVLCDRVKFAGHAPDAGESQAALEAAGRLVRETAAAPPPGASA